MYAYTKLVYAYIYKLIQVGGGGDPLLPSKINVSCFTYRILLNGSGVVVFTGTIKDGK